MSALLGEPFLLANYPTPLQDITKSIGTSRDKGDRHVRVTSSSSDHGQGLATVTVQGDGVYVLELSNMHATLSHTLGPSASFAAPSVTRFNGSDASTSYAIMRTAPGGINMADRDKTVWKWRDRHSWRPEEQPEPRQSALFPFRVEEIWAPSCLSSHVIAVSPSGDVMLSNEDLQVMSTKEISYPQSILLKSFVFGRDKCTFLMHERYQPSETVIVCFILVGSNIKLRIIMAQSTGELEEIAELDLGVHKDVISISCDPTGYTSILSRLEVWQIFRLGHDSSGTVTAASLDKALSLTGLSMLVSPSGGNQIRCDPSVISVGSSFVLLAGISGDDQPEVVLLLWDIQYSVVLATQTFTIPSTVTYSPESSLTVELIPVSKYHALLVLSPGIATTSKRTAGAAPSRSTVLVVPLEIPRASTIALAMGKARDTQKWLRIMHTTSGDVGPGHGQVVQSVQQALEQGQPQAAETAFFAWVGQETVRLQSLRKADVPSDKDASEKNTSDSEAASKTRRKTRRKADKRKGPSSPHLSHQFVLQLLSLILRPSKPSDAVYPSKIVKYLIRRKAISHAMIEEGLLPALRRYRDWGSITSALENVPDLSEDDIVRLLLEVVRSHRLRQDPDPGGMQVDSPSDVPSLPSILAMVVVYTTSPSTLRLALKMHLTDARDIVCILEVLEGWLTGCDTYSGLAFDLANLLLDGVQAANPNKGFPSSRQNKTPPLDSLLAFLQCVLDVHFLTLLQFTPSHRVIATISRHIHEQLLSTENLIRLRGALEAFVRTQSQKSHAQRRELKSGDPKHRRKEAFETAELTIGLYKIEELII